MTPTNREAALWLTRERLAFDRQQAAKRREQVAPMLRAAGHFARHLAACKPQAVKQGALFA